MTTTTQVCERWRDVYRMALLEPDPAKLVQRISDARLAIIERIEATLRLPYGPEHQAMYGALKGLRNLCLRCEAEAQRKLEWNLARNLEKHCSPNWQDHVADRA